MKFFLVLNETSLSIAIENNNIDIIRVLLEHPNIDINLTTINNFLI